MRRTAFPPIATQKPKPPALNIFKFRDPYLRHLVRKNSTRIACIEFQNMLIHDPVKLDDTD